MQVTGMHSTEGYVVAAHKFTFSFSFQHRARASSFNTAWLYHSLIVNRTFKANLVVPQSTTGMRDHFIPT